MGIGPVLVACARHLHAVEPGVSPGVDALGDPLPAIPHTDYAVTMLNVFKGSMASGDTIQVMLAGGDTPEGEFVLEGAPAVNDGESALFFLVAGGEGRYYPLAGGAAIAARGADGTFSLPPDATGEAAHAVSEAEVRAAVGSQAPPSSSEGLRQEEGQGQAQVRQASPAPQVAEAPKAPYGQAEPSLGDPRRSAPTPRPAAAGRLQARPPSRPRRHRPASAPASRSRNRGGRSSCAGRGPRSRRRRPGAGPTNGRSP